MPGSVGGTGDTQRNNRFIAFQEGTVQLGRENFSTDTKEETELQLLGHRHGYPKMEILRAT